MIGQFILCQQFGGITISSKGSGLNNDYDKVLNTIVPFIENFECMTIVVLPKKGGP